MSALSRPSRWGLRSIALMYLSALLIVPVAMIFYRTFEHGLSQPIDAITSSDGLHAFWLTIVCVGIAVPLNTVFGDRHCDRPGPPGLSRQGADQRG